MNVSCPDCGSVFRVDPAKVAPDGVRAKCSICGGVIAIASPRPSAHVILNPTPIVPAPAVVEVPAEPRRSSGTVRTVDATPPTESAAASREEALEFAAETSDFAEIPMEAPSAATEGLDFPPLGGEESVPSMTPMTPARPLTPIDEAPIVAPPRPRSTEFEPLLPETHLEAPHATAGGDLESDRPAANESVTAMESPAPVFATPSQMPTQPAAPIPPARPALSPPVRSPTPRTTMPTTVPPATPIASPLVGGFRPGPAGIPGTAGISARPAATPAPVATPAATPPVSPTVPTPANIASIPTPMVTPALTTPLHSTPVVGGDAVPRRPVNPFLANDPSAKAKRLARALVSDMIAYLPQKREEGLRDGTLKQIFREEIKKSYEEYVDQIGREIAENTTHFQEALNDLLAGGQKIF